MIWNASLAIAADESRVRKLVVALTEVFESAHFPEKTAASVAAILAEDSEDFDRLRPLIRLLRYLTIEPLSILLAKVRTIALNRGLHLEAIKLVYDERSLSDLPEPVFRSAIEPYKSRNADDSNLAIYGVFAAVDGDQRISDEISVPGSDLRVRIALKAPEYMGNDNIELDFEPPEEVVDSVLFLLTSEVPELRTGAFSCLKALISNDVVIQPEYAEWLVNKFAEIYEDNISAFFDLLLTFIFVDDVDHLVQSIS
jgi:hypothetical protein